MKPTYPVSIDTLGKLIDHGIGAFMVCPTCAKARRSDVRTIDLERLAGHLGRNWCFINRRWPEQALATPSAHAQEAVIRGSAIM